MTGGVGAALGAGGSGRDQNWPGDGAAADVVCAGAATGVTGAGTGTVVALGADEGTETEA